jgi:hypothetical protein
MVYFRVALRSKPQGPWAWRSDSLNSHLTLFQFLGMYKAVQKDAIRIFFATSKAILDDMLRRENDGLLSNSMTLEQFLHCNRRICPAEIEQLEAKITSGGDHDIPYAYVCSDSLPQLLAWLRLSVRVRNGELVL